MKSSISTKGKNRISVNNPVQSLFFILFFLRSSTTIYSDVAPMQYQGFTLSPYQNDTIQMKAEKVDMYWGKPCKVIAVFELINPTSMPIDMKIGFPTNLSSMKYSRQEQADSINRIYDFIFNLNGQNLVETDIPERVISSKVEYWYGWTCRLKPKSNIITLTYNVRTNSSYAADWQRNLHYVLYTGKFWNGAIEKAEVAIHFPEAISKEQILKETSPSGYNLGDSCINWTFTSFKPTVKSNIHLRLIDFNTYLTMNKFKRILKDSSIDNKSKIEAALFYASLVTVKGINFTAPAEFDTGYYKNEILPSLSPSEKNVFLSTYTLLEYGKIWFPYHDDRYRNFMEDENVQHTIKQALERIGYFRNVEYSEFYPFIDIANRLFREVVAKDPRNADAWKAYIENDYLLDIEGCNPCKGACAGRGPIGEGQKMLVKEAYSHCSSDPAIKLWYDFVTPENAILPDTIGQIEKREKIYISIQKNEGGWANYPLSSEELDAFKRKYTVSKGNYLVINSNAIDNNAKNDIVAILYRDKFYHFKLCRDLQKLK